MARPGQQSTGDAHQDATTAATFTFETEQTANNPQRSAEKPRAESAKGGAGEHGPAAAGPTGEADSAARPGQQSTGDAHQDATTAATFTFETEQTANNPQRSADKPRAESAKGGAGEHGPAAVGPTGEADSAARRGQQSTGDAHQDATTAATFTFERDQTANNPQRSAEKPRAESAKGGAGEHGLAAAESAGETDPAARRGQP